MKFGTILKQLRLNSSLTQEELATRLNKIYEIKLNKGMISKWEANKSEPSMKYIRVFSKFFNVTLDYLLGLEENNITTNLYNISEDEEQHIENLRKLNDIGKNKVITYTKDLMDNPKFISESIQKQSEDEISSTSLDDFEPYLLAAHSDGLDEETNKANIEKIKKKYLEIRGK